MRSFTPDEYVTGRAKFYGRDFIVSPDVLIPRIETEEIIPMVLRHSGRVQDLLIADIGTGSGCLGITLAEKYPEATVYLSDISDKALKIAQKNATREIILKSNLLENYPDILFDIIVANLPYIPTKRIPRLLAAVRKYEPTLALDGGPKGVTIINRLLAQLPKHLKLSGLAILEIDDTHTVKSFKVPKVFKAKIKKDQFGRNRFLILHPHVV